MRMLALLLVWVGGCGTSDGGGGDGDADADADGDADNDGDADTDGGACGCGASEWCQLAADGSHSCTTDCTDDARQCPDRICCALGSRCMDGTCKLPDLTIDEAYLVESITFQQRIFEPGACEIVEACVPDAGERCLLRFALKTPNIGEGDLYFGDPNHADLFTWSDCHAHFHFNGYARYRLLDGKGNEIAPGHKQAFCLLDYEPLDGTTTNERYTCEYQGIQTGWSDIYEAHLACQWVDVTGVAPGDYFLEARVNFGEVIPESSLDNNVVTVPVNVPATCESQCGGCGPATSDDPFCCRPGDPCSWAGDMYCDCGGDFAWDGEDCSICPACPGGG